MAMNIKNAEVERLAEEVAQLAGESKTEAIRRALEERKARLSLQVVRTNRQAALMEFLERQVWPVIPPDQLGKRITKAEKEELLGYGPEGV